MKIINNQLTTILTISLFGNILLAEVGIGTDIVNRYVWRGTDYGNAAAIQPYLEYSTGIFTVGAWSSWSVNGSDSGNENDIYVTLNLGAVLFTVTDYFFPSYSGEDALFNYKGDSGPHILELSTLGTLRDFTMIAAYNFSGDVDKSTYLEFSYKFLKLGVGNGFYSTDGVFDVVNVGITAEKDQFTASYIINPNAETSFLVFGISF